MEKTSSEPVPKIDWQKVGIEPPPGESTAEIFQDFFVNIDEVLREMVKREGGADLDDGIGNLTLLLAEVAADMTAALKLEPFSVLVTDTLPENKWGRAIKLKRKHLVLLNSKLLLDASSTLSRASEETDWNQIKADLKPVAQAVFALAHELGHIRQYQYLSGKFTHQDTSEISLKEKQLVYLSSSTETHAEALAMRYFRRKQSVGSEIWRALETTKISSDFMEAHMVARATLEVSQLAELLKELPKVRKKQPRKELQVKIARLYMRQQSLSDRMAKMRSRMESLSTARPR